MTNPAEIAEKACKVIYSCVNMQHAAMATQFAALAEKRIMQHKFVKNYEYATVVNNALLWKYQDLINQKVINLEQRFENNEMNVN